MEIFFLDVAQGTCQIILLGERRAIVIDCGAGSDRLVVQFLCRRGIEYIERLIVSHSHNDHIGGAVGVLAAYQDRIGEIFFVQDHLFLQSNFWFRISEFLSGRNLRSDQLVRLEATEKPQDVWLDDARSYRLCTHSPAFAENLFAQEGEKPNHTSAILFLDAGSHRIIFAADSEISQWRRIRGAASDRINCDILAVPHHAGNMNDSADDLEWLFDKALSVGIAVISVGTSNTFGHPRKNVIDALVTNGAKILCSQITRHCHNDLESIRPGVLQPVLHPGRSSPTEDRTTSGNSRNVACAGTVRAELTESGFVVDRLDDHQSAVDLLPQTATKCPLCRCVTSTA